MNVPLIVPDWPAPATVKAFSTTRQGGVSLPPWDSLNLGSHVGDDLVVVERNRDILGDLSGGGAKVFHWLDQVHGNDVLEVPDPQEPISPEPASKGQRRADAATTTQAGHVCTILTADCLPVLFCDRSGTRVAAAHAGWRGLAGGVLENTLARFERPDTVMAWLGPAIGPASFEVGPEVREAFLAGDPGAAECFRTSPHSEDRFMADIYALARRRLQAAGVKAVFGGGRCTVEEPDSFFSFRRDGQTGRQATLVWLE